MKSLILILISISLFSCSPEKRLARLIDNHPELIKHDTIMRMDTTIIPGIAHDTIFKSTITRDTMVIKDHQLTIRYYNDGKTTYLKGVCDTVWAIKEVPVAVNSINPVDHSHSATKWDTFCYWWFAITALLSGVYVLFRLKY